MPENEMKEQLHSVGSSEFTAAMKMELWIGNQIQQLATVHIGNSVHWYNDSEDWNGIQ